MNALVTLAGLAVVLWCAARFAQLLGDREARPDPTPDGPTILPFEGGRDVR